MSSQCVQYLYPQYALYRSKPKCTEIKERDDAVVTTTMAAAYYCAVQSHRNAEVCEFAHILSSTLDSINASTHNGNRDCKYLPSPSSIIHFSFGSGFGFSRFHSLRPFCLSLYPPLSVYISVFMSPLLSLFRLYTFRNAFCNQNVVHLIFVIVFFSLFSYFSFRLASDSFDSYFSAYITQTRLNFCGK